MLGRTQVRGAPAFSPSQGSSSPVQQRPGIAVSDGFDRPPIGDSAERRAAIQVVAKHYYPIGHPRLHVVENINLDKIGPVGRVDEVGTLKTCILVMPTALAGQFDHSPNAASGPKINTHRAFVGHARLVREMLDRGATVYLLVHPAAATEASFATDITTAIANKVVVSSPLQSARRLELQRFSGGLWLDADGRKDGPVEWGDTLQATRNGVHYVIQGVGSMRGDSNSIDRMARLVHGLRQEGRNIEHVAIQLAGADTLHLDYAVNYAGQGKSRSMLVAPHAIANPNDVTRLQELFEVGDRGVMTVSREAMLRGAANISCPNPREAFMSEDRATERPAEFLSSRGVGVIRFPFQHFKKDGLFHCVMGQILRV